MAGRSNTELKVFLNGSLDDYRTFCQNPNDTNAKLGSVFFDKTNHTIYVEGNKVVGTQVENVVWDNDDKILTIYPISGAPINVELGVDDALTNLESTLKAWANTEFEAKDATILRQGNVVDNVTTTSTIAPLSANQGKVLKGLIDTNTTKLAGIDEGAQTNRQITVNDAIVGTDANETNITITGNLIRVTDPEGGVLSINLYGEYDSAQKKIVFKTDDTEDALDLFDIDATDFIKDSFVKGGSYDADKKALILTLVTGKNDDGSDKTEPVEIPVGGLIDEYTAGNGLSLSGTTFSAKLGNGLQIDTYKSITLKPTTNGGITVNAAGVAVDWTKAPIQKVNNVTPDANGNVSIDVTPKVWSF